MNLIILNVALADLAVICYSCLMQLVIDHDRTWIAGNAMCKILKFLQTLFIVASSYMVIVLSADRHQAICSPLRQPVAVSNLYG